MWLHLLSVCYFGLSVEPRLVFSLPLLELLLKRLKRECKTFVMDIFYNQGLGAPFSRKAKPLPFRRAFHRHHPIDLTWLSSKHTHLKAPAVLTRCTLLEKYCIKHSTTLFGGCSIVVSRVLCLLPHGLEISWQSTTTINCCWPSPTSYTKTWTLKTST